MIGAVLVLMAVTVPPVTPQHATPALPAWTPVLAPAVVVAAPVSPVADDALLEDEASGDLSPLSRTVYVAPAVKTSEPRKSTHRRRSARN